MHVELWSLARGKPHVMCEIRAKDGKLHIDTREPIPPPIQKDIVAQHGRIPGDKAFLESLPVEFNGSYLWAKLII